MDDLCKNYLVCGGHVNPNSRSGLCYNCAQAERIAAQDAKEQKRKMDNHRRAEVRRCARIWWRDTEPGPADELAALMCAWRWETQRAVEELREWVA